MEVPLKIEYRNIKYPRLEFKGLQLHIILPLNTANPTQIINRNKAWIEKKWNKIKEATKNFSGNEEFMIFGEKYKIEKTNNHKTTINHKQRRIIINLQSQKHKEKIIHQLKKILKERLEAIINEYSTTMNIKPRKIIIRRQKTRWGSCSNIGNINLNLKLVCIPEEMIRYVVYHEINHIKFRKHNKNFWNIIIKRYPNHKWYKEKLFEYWFITEKLFQNLLET
ncbi:MAG: YgjP-like metallopeptidase domain-containing protein [Candidatus Methanomethylicia archaeon]